ncbi:Uncharacterised protein [Mycobacteroides abscessus subsp. abscessus]|nr:Uncharacterised protein [Mycobacteroides abscessus subsp. abscessus]
MGIRIQLEHKLNCLFPGSFLPDLFPAAGMQLPAYSTQKHTRHLFKG